LILDITPLNGAQ